MLSILGIVGTIVNELYIYTAIFMGLSLIFAELLGIVLKNGGKK